MSEERQDTTERKVKVGRCPEHGLVHGDGIECFGPMARCECGTDLEKWTVATEQEVKELVE